MFVKVKEGVALDKELTKEERYVNGGWPGKKVTHKQTLRQRSL